MIERQPVLAPDSTPRHVAIVMDGVRSWCTTHGLPVAEGYRRSAAALEAVVADAIDAGIEALSVFAAPDERWQSGSNDGSGELEAAGTAALDQLRLFRNHVRVRIIGRRDRLPAALANGLAALEEATADQQGLLLSVAVDYSARRDVADAARSLASQVAAGTLNVDAIDDARLAGALTTAGVSDPDLFIRTGGGVRLADFLLYQCAYAELWATPALWPDFNAGLMRDAIAAYGKRQRRFGR